MTFRMYRIKRADLDVFNILTLLVRSFEITLKPEVECLVSVVFYFSPDTPLQEQCIQVDGSILCSTS